MSDVSIPVDGGQMGAALELPARSPAPGLLLIQEIFGVNAGMRTLARHWAEQGYAVLCPDLFWRQQPGVQLTDRTEAEWQQAMSLYRGFDLQRGLQDLAAAAGWLRRHAACTGKVASLGFCLGGRLAVLLAATDAVDASIGYYPVALDQHVPQLRQIRQPLMVHVAGQDKYATPEMRALYEPLLRHNPLVSWHLYPAQDHAFARPDGQHYDREAALLAEQRSQQHLVTCVG